MLYVIRQALLGLSLRNDGHEFSEKSSKIVHLGEPNAA
jgi:hypothetical protein